MPTIRPSMIRLCRLLCIGGALLAFLPSFAQLISEAPAAVAKQPTRAGAARAVAHPTWAELSPAQQQALSPLVGEWDKMEAVRKKKWLEVVAKFSSMAPDEQARVQERMREWVKLTPEQRRIARENYTRAKKIGPEQKSAQWQEYQQLSDDEKKKLAQERSQKKHVANLPPPSQPKPNITPLIKAPVAKPPVKEEVRKPVEAAAPAPAPAPPPPAPAPAVQAAPPAPPGPPASTSITD